MSKFFLEVPQKQRVDVLGTLNESTTDVWIALHGYGQLVEYFQRHFRSMVTPTRAFVFPQGAHADGSAPPNRARQAAYCGARCCAKAA